MAVPAGISSSIITEETAISNIKMANMKDKMF